MQQKATGEEAVLPSGVGDPGDDPGLVLGEIQLLLAEKRTALSVMRTGIAIFALPLSVLSVLIAGCAGPETRTSDLQGQTEGGHLENIARGRPVRYSTPPDYRHCTDPGDDRQLTDGQYVSGYFWTQRGTVGWTRARPVIITLDLGRVEPIRGVSFSTAAGTAGVFWPQAIYVLASDDGERWLEAGDLVDLSRVNGEPPASGYAVHRFRTEAIQVSGRYVAFILSTAVYGFVDEIEVYRGDPARAPEPDRAERLVDLRAYYRNRVIGQFVSARIARDARRVRELVDRAPLADAARVAMRAELAAVETEGPALHAAAWPADFTAVLPVHDAHRRVFRVLAGVWQADGAAPITVWTASPWDPLEIVHSPPPTGAPSISLSLMMRETRAAVLHLSNATPEDREVSLSIEGLPGGRNPPWISVHEVAWTDTNQGIPVAAALPPAPREDGAYCLGIPSGMTRQVWLSLRPDEIEPGVHRGFLRMTGLPEVPFVVRVSRIRFPDRPALHLGGWDYTDADAQYEITPGNREEVIAHLRDRFVDSPWATAAVLAHGTHADDGRLTTAPDTTRFDAWVDRWAGARQYCVYAAAGARYDRFEPGTAAFDAAVGAWIRFWSRHAASRGLDPGQLLLLLVDEPSLPEQDALIRAWARAIRAAGTGVRIFEDPLHIDPAREADPEMLAACDVLCLHRPRFYHRASYRDFYTTRKPPGTELAFYSCNGPVRLLDPYAYHRLQAWTCWKYGAAGSYFWSFGDSGGASSWNEYVSSRYPYVPFFLEPDGVTAGKHMEAVREGVEDYEYLVMLREAIAVSVASGVDASRIDRARTLLAEAADRVLGTPTVDSLQWGDAKDRAGADRVRVEILTLLESLGGGE